jgi:hypothetical protein
MTKGTKAENQQLVTQHSNLQHKYITLLEDKVAQLQQQTQPKPKRAAHSNLSEVEVLKILRLHTQGQSKK